RLSRDWSSDVCSSDLIASGMRKANAPRARFSLTRLPCAPATSLTWAVCLALAVVEWETPGWRSSSRWRWVAVLLRLLWTWEEARSEERRVGEEGSGRW